MRKIALLVLAGIGLAGAASAADIAPLYRKASPPAAAYMWQGSYVGLYAGGATGADNITTTNLFSPALAGFYGGVNTSASYKYGSSFIGGFTDGYNWQVSPNWVLGYESETGYISVKGSSGLPGLAGGFANAVATTSLGATYSAWTARVGYAWDRSLFYAKGGAVLAQVETGVTNGTVAVHVDSTTRKYALGYAAGAGWEYALDNKWSLKAEYLYLGFDKNITTTTNFNGGFPQSFSTTTLAGIHTGKVGLNYKWDWFALLR